MTLTAPPIANIWGNTNTTSADMVNPGGILNTGFLPPPTVPDREHMNWILNYLHNAVRYFSARGIPDWNASETQYVVGSVVWYPTTGLYYRLAVASPAGTAPDVDTAHWALFFAAIPGTLLNRRVVTSSGSYAKTAGTTKARFRMVGAGGGSAGVCAALGPGRWTSGGAASGSWGEFETTVIPANWTVVIGAAGAAGSAPGTDGAYNAGTNGGDTTLSDGTNTFTCKGGSASTGMRGGASRGVPTASPGGTIVFGSDGQRGGDGEQTDAYLGVYSTTGPGGSCPYGASGNIQTLLSATDEIPYPPVASTGYGAGGSGSSSYNNTSGAGNGNVGIAGRPGLLILEEWS